MKAIFGASFRKDTNKERCFKMLETLSEPRPGDSMYLNQTGKVAEGDKTVASARARAPPLKRARTDGWKARFRPCPAPVRGFVKSHPPDDPVEHETR